MSVSLQGVRLLLVEDEAMVAIMLEEMLAGLGCEVVGVAGSVAQGLDATEDADQRLDAAILDVNLGGEKVYPVADRLAAKGVPFMFSTGYGLAGIAPDYARIPALAKPYGPEALEQALLSVLRGRGA
jgi:CheY-like chemotaxis protein